MNGNVTQDGAELDLAWMKRMGIGGVHIFSGSLLEPRVVSPPTPFMSESWKKIFRSMTNAARQAGMDVTIAGSPGWSETGGIWVAPEDAMKKYVWSETIVDGGKAFQGKLAQPPATTGPFQALKVKRGSPKPLELTHDVYQDTVVVAFPTPLAAVAQVQPIFSSNSEQFDVALTRAYGQTSPTLLSLPGDQKPLYIQAEYPHALSIHALTLGLSVPADVEIQATGADGTFHTILRVAADRSDQPAPQQTVSFPVVETRLIRAVLTPVASTPPVGLAKMMPARTPINISLTYIGFHTVDRVNEFEAKAGFASTIDFASVPTPAANITSVVNSKDVVDLTAHFHADGSLDWHPPQGQWTVLRIGSSLTGQTNAPAEGAATGLEVDKLDPALVRAYMEHYLDLYKEASGGKLGPSGVQSVLTDSWEAGVQNWTPTILTQFKNRRGYNATGYLPALCGWVVDDAQKSDRFLWDFRRSLKEMVADNHNGTLAKVMHEHHMGYYTEAEGDYPRAIGDGMTMKARSDVPTGEFWYRPFATDPGQPPLKADLEESASVAHVYGKKFAASESLTVGALTDPWSFSPAMLKPVVDEIFAHGINRILLHESHHQPFVDKKPGLELGLFGQYFNRNDTWAEQAKPWVDYLARTSFLLQQGRFVADVAYFYGEDRNLSEIYLHRFNTDVPKGYGYDYINSEALMRLLSVRNGKIVTPSGMSYRVLYLPQYVDRMTLPALKRLRDLVATGAVVAGPKPIGGLGLQDTDSEVKTIADQLWGHGEANRISHSFGAGRVYRTTDLALVLRTEKVQRDIEIANADPDSVILSLHRHDVARDFYFIANQLDRPEDVTVKTRGKAQASEIWRAETATSEAASFHATSVGVDTIVHLQPHEAVFLVLHPSTLSSRTVPLKKRETGFSLDGPWTVHFETGLGAPESVVFPHLSPWNESKDDGIKYFSGHAIYTQTLTIPAKLQGSQHRTLLDLGEVHEIAEVSINGSAPTILWHGPYELDVTDALHLGPNTITITVTNLWPNRLIGDKQPGAQKYTFAPQSPYSASSSLLRSGLIGPVRLMDQWVTEPTVTTQNVSR